MAHDPRIGTTIAGYRIESVVGRGGMGVVYLAEQMTLGRKVALKILAPELAADARFRQRFLRESRIAASLEDPNILPIHEAGEAEGLLFIAMRYVDGTDLKAVIEAEGPLPGERVVSIVSQVASALDAAHDRGLIHRDVKPANILLVPSSGGSRPDKVYLADFGLTKRATSDSGITGTGQFVGTLDYAAPEQFTGEPLSPQTDVYSLGCVLYESLTGDPPFPREREAAVLHAHLQEPPPKVTAKRGGLPIEIDSVVARAMSKDPRNRHESAGAVAAAAREAVEDAAAGRARALPRRRMLRIGAPLAATLVIVAVIAAVVLSQRGPAGLGDGNTTDSAGTSGAIRVSTGVVEIDPNTGRVGNQVEVGRIFGGLPKVASGEGAIWLPELGNLIRIDPLTGHRQTISVGTYLLNVAVGQGALWASGAAGSGLLIRIDPATNEVVKQVPVRISAIGSVYAATVPGAAWAASGTGYVVRVDAGSNRAGKPRKVASSIAAVAYGLRALWILDDFAATLLKVDPRTAAVLERFPIGGNPRTMAVGFGSVWVADSSGTVYKVDPDDGTTIGPIRVGASPTGITTGFGRVWVTNHGDGTISRIDPATNDVSEIALHAPVASVTADSRSHRLWVAVASGNERD